MDSRILRLIGAVLPCCCSVYIASITTASAQDAMSIIDRGPSHRTWKGTVQVIDPATRQIQRRPSQYTELSDGMHYWDGEWKESKDLVELIGNNAVARYGPIKVIFGPNLNRDGVIDMESPDGKRFRSRVAGLFFFDAESGKSAVVARVKDSIGKLVPPNQVVYEDAFEGLAGDVQYIYTKGGFEQNVILRQKPTPPARFKLNPLTTRLEVWTEFSEAACRQPLHQKTTI